MIVIGIDPGTLITGFAVIEYRNSLSSAVDYGTIRPSPKAPLPQRYHAIFSALEELLLKYQPGVLAIETQFVGKNVQSAIKLGMARGVCVLAAAKRNIEVKEYSPTTTKRAVVGKGHAGKQQVQKMIRLLLHLEELPEEDEADALAVALCHIHSVHCGKTFQPVGRS